MVRKTPDRRGGPRPNSGRPRLSAGSLSRKTAVSMSSEMYDALQARADADEVSRSTIVQRALQRFLKKSNRARATP